MRSIQTHIHRGPEGEGAGDEEKETERERNGETGRKDTCSDKEPGQRDGEMEMGKRDRQRQRKMVTKSCRERERPCEIEANTKGTTMTPNPSKAPIKTKVRAPCGQEPCGVLSPGTK